MIHLAHSAGRDEDVAGCEVSVDKRLPSKIGHARCNLLTEAETQSRQFTVLWQIRSSIYGAK